MNEPEPSQAMELLTMIWKRTGTAARFSWNRLNRSMQRALYLAIDSGLRFDVTDFKEMAEAFDSERWIGAHDGWYFRCIKSGNRSAVLSYEAAKNRKPFLFDMNWEHGIRTRTRLYVGAQFYWRSRTTGEYQRLEVTSFALDGKFIIACLQDKSVSPVKTLEQYRITHADLRADMAERKKQAQAEEGSTG